jgi:hypothetical protein
LIAIAIYATHYNNPVKTQIPMTVDPGWSFGLCVAALVLDVITTILLVINAVKKPNL